MRHPIALLSTAAAIAACGSEAPGDRPDLRAAADRTQLTLRQAVPLALASSEGGSPVDGWLVPNQTAFDVGERGAAGMNEIRVSGQDGALMAVAPVAPPNVPPCTGDVIPLDQALALAETRASGEAIAVVPDDDEACAREIQVLSGVTLWEVKVAGDGTVLEVEQSDEYSGKED
jgi:hypothetical protein